MIRARGFAGRLLRSLAPLLSMASIASFAGMAGIAAPAAATSFVAMEDGALADQAAVIAEVRVDAIQPSPVGAALSTDYQVSILRLVKGTTAGSSLLVRVPGGVGADGLGSKIWGAPEFQTADRALLFLRARPDGTYRVHQLMLGAFHEADVAGHPVVLRNLGEATEVHFPLGTKVSASPGEDRPRDLERFAAWLADRSRGVARPADYFVDLPKGALHSLSEKFTLIFSRGRHLRWPDFDFGGSIPFLADPTGQVGLAGGGFAEFQSAIAIWNNDFHTPISYTYGGTTPATGGLSKYDSVNALLFDDPNDEIGFPFDCQHGGILAASTPWVQFSQRVVFKGETMYPIVGGDIVTNKNLACFYNSYSPDAASAVAAEILAHELGHTLGLGHSCGDVQSPPCTDPIKNDALMRAFVHGDGRGARLGADDVAAIRYLYDPSPRTLVPCKPSATTLCLDNKRFQVDIVWYNQFNNTLGVGRAVPATDATGYFSFGDPSNIEILVKALDFGGSTVKIFYGELTDLFFTLNVTDTRTGVVKTYHNTSGDCGAIDQGFYNDLAPASPASSASGAPSLAALSFNPQPAAAASGRCRADRTTLCLLNGRFAVHVHWQNPFDGSKGEGGPASLSNFVGTFFFTDRNNVELMVKVLPFTDQVSLYYGALTDFQYTLEVNDTLTGRVKTYLSTAGRLCGGLDNDGF
jgi:hypothetical protein